jgi:hypothetical protein
VDAIFHNPCDLTRSKCEIERPLCMTRLPRKDLEINLVKKNPRGNIRTLGVKKRSQLDHTGGGGSLDTGSSECRFIFVPRANHAFARETKSTHGGSCLSVNCAKMGCATLTRNVPHGSVDL